MSRVFLFVAARPWLGYTLLALISAVAAIGVARLEFDDDYLNIIRSRRPEFTALEQSHRAFHDEVNELVIVVDTAHGSAPSPSPLALISRETLGALRRLVDALEADPAIDATLSIFDAMYAPLRTGTPNRPLIPRH